MSPQQRATHQLKRAAGPKRAAIYTRASLDATGERESVQRQGKACRGLADARGWIVVAEIEDNSFSAYDDEKERPGWDKVLGMAERGEIDVIIAWHFDRVTRSMKALELLIEYVERTGVGVATATGDIDLTTDTGRMIARILTAVARCEVERKSARQMLANEARAAIGQPWIGGPKAFGYKPDHMTVIEEEAQAFVWAANAALEGMSMRMIAAELEARGHHSSRAKHTASGTGWTHGGIRKMLMSPRYAGIRIHKGEEMGIGAWPPLIDLDTHLALRRLLSDPARDKNAGTHNSRKPANLLSLIAKCATCGDGTTLIAGARHGEPRYTCRSNKGCVYTPRAELDKAVTEALLGLLSTKAFVQSLTPVGDERAAAARRQLDKLYARLKVVRREYDAGMYDDDEDGYSERVAEFGVKIREQKAIIDELADAALFEGLSVGTTAVIAQWATRGLEQRRAIIERLLDITVRPVGARQKWVAEKHLVVARRRAA